VVSGVKGEKQCMWRNFCDVSKGGIKSESGVPKSLKWNLKWSNFFVKLNV